MSSLWIYCLLLVLHNLLLPAVSCTPLAIPIDVVVDIQKCVCDAQTANADCCQATRSQLDLLQSNVDSLIDVIEDVLTGISNLDTFISQYEILLAIGQDIDINLVRLLVNTIFSTGSSFEHIASLIDSDIALDETILSTVSAIDTNAVIITSLVENLIAQNCASTNDLIVSGLEQISSGVQHLESVLEQISYIDDVIASNIAIIDMSSDAVQSSLDVLATQGCGSSQDGIVSSLDLLQQQEASCCQQLSLQLSQLQSDVDSRIDRIPSISFIEQFVTIMSAVNIIESDILSYIDIAESGFDYITSRLDLLQECAPISVQPPVTISTPGNYCLAADSSGDITIAASGVTLNLNNRALLGSLIINTGLQDIVVGNGRINGSGVDDGITIQPGVANITLSSLFITNFLTGVACAGTIGNPVSNVVIDQVTVTNSSLTGYLIQEANGVMTNSLALQNTGGGINVVNTNSSFTIVNTQSINNGSFGFQVVGGANFDALSAALYDSFAYANTSSGFTFSNCLMYVKNCTSQNNGIDGFLVNNLSASSVQGSIIDCKSLGNTRGGFNVINSATPVGFIGNYSADNGVFAYGVNGVSVNTNVAPYYWLDSNNTSITGYNNANGV